MTFLSLCRLSRQVYDLKTSVKEIASRLDLIMTRLQLHDEIKARETTKQLAATKNVCMEYVVSMNPILAVSYQSTALFLFIYICYAFIETDSVSLLDASL